MTGRQGGKQGRRRGTWIAGPLLGLVGFLLGHAITRPAPVGANCPKTATYTPVAATVDGAAVGVPPGTDAARVKVTPDQLDLTTWTPTGGAQSTFTWSGP